MTVAASICEAGMRQVFWPMGSPTEKSDPGANPSINNWAASAAPSTVRPIGPASSERGAPDAAAMMRWGADELAPRGVTGNQCGKLRWE